MDIKKLGKGCVPQLFDERDYKAETVFGAPVVDFSQEFRLPEPPNENQDGSLSCVSQAWSYYHWQLKGKDYSRRDLYSRIFLVPGGGAALRDGGKEICGAGHATRDEALDPIPQTETAMRSKDGITSEEQSSDIEASYYSMINNINNVAYAIQNFKGAVFGVAGDNIGWQDKTNPSPPTGTPDWFHAIYGMGFHTHDGQKCIIAKSSWADATHHEHHIKENYFNVGRTFDLWVLIPKGDSMKLVNDGGTFFIEGEKGKIGIADLPFLNALRAITDQIENRAAVGPQVRVVETASNTFIIKDQ